MASSFAFGFSGDDIEVDAGDADEDEMQIDVPDHDTEHTKREEKLILPQKHTLKDIVSHIFRRRNRKRHKRWKGTFSFWNFA
jgi:hypothetical protein